MYFVATGEKPSSNWFKSVHDGVMPESSTVMNIDDAEIGSPSTEESHEPGGMSTATVNPSNQVDQEQLKSMHDTCLEWLEDITTKAKENPDMYAALSKYCNTIKNLRTDNATLSALHTFGRQYTTRHSGRIPVQPTAVGRRKFRLKGRSVALLGRPRNSTVLTANLHQYACRRISKRKPHKLSAAHH